MPLPTALALLLALAAQPARNGVSSLPPPAGGGPGRGAVQEFPAPSDAEVHDRVDAWLGAIDRPIAPERWRALGPRAVPALAAVANDAGALPSRRAAAIAALSAIGGDAARDASLALARSDRAPFSVRASALESAGRLVPAADLARDLAPVLASASDRGVRAAAAKVLADRAPAEACGAIRAQAAREHERARPAFAGALGKCASTP
jgi:hypothetical protein